ncbi:MAG: lytic transglycosylase [Candidatus Aeolococcus gillhamiae]|uniref:Lytic transglycosylase n=1 Tax=Candidatus Aeolococcus gillhamiae TaxID=3127015 RepID=A0A2W5Z4K4_9BACT|nr:MAG: lytic transglycosylase [Candidatus Dormibacter sp. RRmetagenome_bin12]
MRSLAAALTAALVFAGCAGRPSAVARLGGVLTAPSPAVGAAVDSPTVVIATLAAVETSIRDPSTPGADLDRLGRQEQELYRALFAHPDWQPAAVAGVPSAVRPAVEANLAAAAELARLSGPKPELPHWRVVTPAPAASLVAYYKRAGAASGVAWPYLAAINLVETRMGRIRGASSAGAQGPMQFLPSTWAIYGAGGDINSEHDAIAAAARLLRANGAPKDMARALLAYNNSKHYVNAVTAYAGVIAADERAYVAYHAWQVYYGDRLLPEGFTNP